jgi:CII-binding regulator of phage lambda lysogenization HflD
MEVNGQFLPPPTLRSVEVRVSLPGLDEKEQLEEKIVFRTKELEKKNYELVMAMEILINEMDSSKRKLKEQLPHRDGRILSIMRSMELTSDMVEHLMEQSNRLKQETKITGRDKQEMDVFLESTENVVMLIKANMSKAMSVMEEIEMLI